MALIYENSVFRSALDENKPVNYMNNRQDIHRSLQELESKIVKTCQLCKRCYFCFTYHNQYNKLKNKGFFSLLKNVIYWEVRNSEFNFKNEKYEIFPVHKIEDWEDLFFVI